MNDEAKGITLSVHEADALLAALRAASDDIGQLIRVARYNLTGEYLPGEKIDRPEPPMLIHAEGIAESVRVQAQLRQACRFLNPLIEKYKALARCVVPEEKKPEVRETSFKDGDQVMYKGPATNWKYVKASIRYTEGDSATLVWFDEPGREMVCPLDFVSSIPETQRFTVGDKVVYLPPMQHPVEGVVWNMDGINISIKTSTNHVVVVDRQFLKIVT
jgi:hypothetical protein